MLQFFKIFCNSTALKDRETQMLAIRKSAEEFQSRETLFQGLGYDRLLLLYSVRSEEGLLMKEGQIKVARYELL